MFLKNLHHAKQLKNLRTLSIEAAVTHRRINFLHQFSFYQTSKPPLHMKPTYKAVRYISRSDIFLQDDIKMIKKKQAEDWGEILGRWYKQYQDFVGISEILQAQEKVSSLTSQLTEVQTQRRHLQKDVESIHQQLLSTQKSITKSELYSEDHYSLFEKARELNSSLKNLQDQFSYKEDEERNLFTQLSAAIKLCHEKEKIQSEQSKYWSILISVVSASLAALITSINNWMRIREIKEHSSLLHKETMATNEQLRSTVANAIKINHKPLGDSSPENKFFTDEIIPIIQNSLKEEFKKISDLIDRLSVIPNEINKPLEYDGDVINSETIVYQPSYVRVLAAGVVGAAIGTVITVTFLGPAGGG